MLRRLARASRTADIGNRALAFYLHEMHERREYQTLGHATAVHLATCRLRIPRTTARELITTGGELLVLKRIDRALCEGEITWSSAYAIACEAIIHRVDDTPPPRDQTNGTRLSSIARTVHERQPPVTAHGETGSAAPSSSGSASPLTADTVDIPTPAWMRTQVLLRDGVRCVCCGGSDPDGDQ